MGAERHRGGDRPLASAAPLRWSSTLMPLSAEGQRVVDELGSIIQGPWIDQVFLARTVEELAQRVSPHEPQVLAAWCRFIDAPVVWECVRAAPPEALLSALLAAQATMSSRAAEQPGLEHALQTALRQVVLRHPLLLAAAPAEHRERLEALADACHVRLPPAPWPNPWTQKRVKPKALEVTPPPFVERLHAERARVPDDPARDEPLVREWKNLQFHALYHLRGMGDSSALELFSTADFAAMWVGDELPELVTRFGLEGLAASLRAVAANRRELGALAPIESPRVAPLMAEGLASHQAVELQAARAWLSQFPRAATMGLVALALSATRAAAEPIAALKFVRRTAPVEFDEALTGFSADAQAAVRALLDEPPALPSRRPNLPGFLDPEALPRVASLDGTTALQGDAWVGFLQLLKVTPLDGAPWIDEARMTFTLPSLAAVAQALFDAWLLTGAPPKEKWMLQSAAHFGDEALARRLAEDAATLAPRGLSARAQEMAEVLGAMRSRTSLTLLHGLIKKVRSKAFRARAELIFTSSAEKMGLSREELAERLVPDFGLSPDGTLPVDPPVRFEVVKGKARFVDASGRPVKAFPATGHPERDEELASLKKRAAALVKEASERLEARMSSERRMSLDHFTELYAMHGLLGALARKLVWGQWRAGRLVLVFRLAGAAPIDAEGRPVTLEADDEVGVVHALHLDDAARAQWTPHSADAPFPQLARPLQRFESAEACARALRKLEGRVVESGQLLALEAAGWTRGDQIGGGCYVELRRPLGRGTVRLQFAPGIYLGDPLLHHRQTIDAIELSPGAGSAVSWSDLVVSLDEALTPWTE
jgi:hypothetical protein